jgi:hypothetical protein
MPKIVIKVDRTAHTRSKTLEVKKVSQADDSKQGDTDDKSRGTTPPMSATKNQPRSIISRVVRSAAVKLADRKFFTVKEDSVILVYLKEHRDSMTSRAIAQKLSKKLKHSLESIRDRIKRFLSKLRLVDEMCIADEAKVILLSPLFFS